MMPSSAASAAPSLPSALRAGLKERVRAALPLHLRMRMAVLVGRSRLPGAEWWTAELVRDLAERDLNAYHRFLWSNHLAYATTYEPEQRFGAERVHPSRRLLFGELARLLADRGVDPARDVRSVLEVGCSMGYLLRHVETDVFPAARVLDGVDIDGYAVERGRRVLRSAGSRVHLSVGDATTLDGRFSHPAYDVVLCAGVLMYLRPADAQAAVAAMLARTAGVLALAGLAHPETDNARLAASVPRERDRTLVHNLDEMVARAGGRVIARRWEGARQVAGNTVYFVFAERARGDA
jgi:SAM-dependent methyltransferase